MRRHSPLGIYVHIPYCLKKCAYCDFLSTPCREEDIPHAKYLAAIRKQLGVDVRERGLSGRGIATIYFGGGTPSLMPGTFFLGAIESLAEHFLMDADVEVSCEVNPATADGKWFETVRGAGITRASVGVQSFNPKLLAALGRIHSSDEAMHAIALAQDAGFGSTSLDLMYAIPGESASDLEDDLRTAMTFQPEHISAYQLTIEEGVPLASQMSRLPSEDEQMRQMRLACRMLFRGGWTRYEISNFARPGFRCRHNLNYWRYGEYLGLGAGAWSFLGGERWAQTRDIEGYISGTASRSEFEIIDGRTAMAEFCFMGLRTTEGISDLDFEVRFGTPIDEIFGNVIRSSVERGLLRRAQGFISLTERGIELSNQVFAKFL